MKVTKFMGVPELMASYVGGVELWVRWEGAGRQRERGVRADKKEEEAVSGVEIGDVDVGSPGIWGK